MILSDGSSISWRFMKVWRRNLVVYRKIWKINFLPPIFEPLLYLLAFGVGFGTLVGKIVYGDREISYVAFIAPALLSVNMMYNAFFENTYASFVRMYYQKTFDAIMATPLSVQEVIVGEIVWGATKSFIATAIMLAVVSLFGLIHYPHGLLILPLSFLAGMAFGAVGMFFTGIVPSIDMFNLPIFLFVTPMFLFSGTFFPLDDFPAWVQKISLVFPLTHLVKVTRSLGLGMVGMDALYGIAYLVVFCLVFLPVALEAMRRRLVH